jgi:cytochrome d ubiquinol oxidase subunit II
MLQENNIIRRGRKQLIFETISFLVCFLTFVIMLVLKKGFAVDSVTGTVFMEPYKYLHNLIQMPLVGIGTVLTVFSLLLVAGFNHTAYYPSSFNLQNS